MYLIMNFRSSTFIIFTAVSQTESVPGKMSKSYD